MRGRDGFARLLVEYCTDVKVKDDVVISSSYEAFPLVREVYRYTVEKGGYPLVRIRDELLDEMFYRYAPQDLLMYLSPLEEAFMKEADVLISIISPTHTKPLISIDPERIKIRSMATRRLTEIFMERDGMGDLRWVVTAYPTRAFAQEAGMSIIEAEDFIYEALKLHTSDPVAEWRRQAEWQDKIVELLSKVSELRIESDNTMLSLNVHGRRWISDDGKKNMPGGEVFTGPHEDSIEGYITFEYPAVWRGIEIEGVKLEFKRGVVVKASALKGEEYLKALLETDEGARRVGEFAFGLNYDIKRHTKNVLFDEKIGGTMHMALGASYPVTGGTNKSSIHWDIVKDMRNARVYADGDLIYENGRFIGV
ncbi:MAG: aminopeptidase [Desulfurococcales archaeon]|nr:aminopeptidase [Desulfurococcales archaeon]